MGKKHNLLMPKLGLTMTKGTLTEWRAEPGQRAREGEVLFVVETEKVANEIEGSAQGCIGEIRVLAGATVPVGEVLATPTDAGGPASAATDPARPTLSNVSKSTIGGDVPVGPGVVATPLARRLAKQSGIDLHTLRGSGPNVQAAASDRTAALQLEGRATAVVLKRRGATRYETTVASLLSAAKRDISHFYVALDADIGPGLALREQMNAWQARPRISVTTCSSQRWLGHCLQRHRRTTCGATDSSRNSRRSTLDLRSTPSEACSHPCCAMSVACRSTRSPRGQSGWSSARRTAN
jgi:pyruvate dehydrogenase E2 component (dihydrolipoamide acetyltransferase)